nr:zinc finger, CCHC-type [Tanacetum cinerariifolium]
MTFIDDASKFCYVYLLHTKDEALDKFKVFKTEVELQQESLIKRFRTDRGDEYMDTLYFQSVSIIHETTAPYSPQQNGISERKNRVLKEMVNSMLSYSGLSQGFWGKAMLTACYSLNRVPNKKNNITPYELWTKKKPNRNYLRVWGFRAAVRIPDPKLKTLGERGIECIFVGYAEHSKAYRFYVIKPNDSVAINSIIESRDAIFDEHRLQTSGLQMNLQKKYEGIDYFDTYAPVARISTIRLLITLASIHNLIIRQMDVKTTFLNGDLEEEVYMNQPLGFIMPGNENKVDLTKEFLSSRFSMKDMGEADVIMGIRIKHESNVLEGYTDASWISNTEDNSFTSGWEAEWLKNLLFEIPLWVKPMASISIRCDSAATLTKAYSHMYNRKSRHLGVRHSMIRELIMNEVASIEFVRSQQNLADHLKKGIDGLKLGLEELTGDLSGLEIGLEIWILGVSVWTTGGWTSSVLSLLVGCIVSLVASGLFSTILGRKEGGG